MYMWSSHASRAAMLPQRRQREATSLQADLHLTSRAAADEDFKGPKCSPPPPSGGDGRSIRLMLQSKATYHVVRQGFVFIQDGRSLEIPVFVEERLS
mmetsp:Transcript_14976/g.26375  ORF Transcript_14976/g.26375 Transcript_14976/m.26375 type:complete len:97 (+) Transcript_14976:1-291(+)